MSKNLLVAVIATLFSLSAFASEEMVQCAVEKDGKSMIVEGKEDGKNDKGMAFINVSKEVCDKLMAGDMSAADEATAAKLVK